MVNKVWIIDLINNSQWQEFLDLIDKSIKNVCISNREEVESIILKSIRLIRKKNKVPNKRESIELLARLRKNYLYAKNMWNTKLNDLIDLIINNPIF